MFVHMQGAVPAGGAGDAKRLDELETRLQQERAVKEEIEQKYRQVTF